MMYQIHGHGAASLCSNFKTIIWVVLEEMTWYGVYIIPKCLSGYIPVLLFLSLVNI